MDRFTRDGRSIIWGENIASIEEGHLRSESSRKFGFCLLLVIWGLASFYVPHTVHSFSFLLGFAFLKEVCLSKFALQAVRYAI